MKRCKFITITLSVVLLNISCNKDDTDPPGMTPNEVEGPGRVYTISNEVAGNNVIMFSRSADGLLTWHAAYPTGDAGTGGGLGSQGAIILSPDNKFVLAVNAGSNSVTSFVVSDTGLTWASTVGSGGIFPVSLAIHNDLVYVLNAGADNNVSGFRIAADGKLSSLEGSTRPLSAADTEPAQVSFTPGGDIIIITEKSTNKIITYTIGSDGTPGVMHSLTSASPTPFGFAVDKTGIVYVSEAVGGTAGASTVSSYFVQSDGSIQLVDGPNAAGQTAACWVVLVNNGKYVYATNTTDGNISSFIADDSGKLDVLQAAAGVTGSGTSPIDAALSKFSKYLYALLAGTDSIAAFEIHTDGSLEAIQTVGGIPNGAAGLAAN